MIFDHMMNYGLYENMHNDFKNAFKFVNDYITDEKPNGKYHINENTYAIVTSYETKLEQSEFETHEKFIDAHFVIKGREIIRWADRNNLQTCTEYNYEDDFTLHTGETQVKLRLHEGNFAVFFPNDAHIPKYPCDNKPEDVKKIIIKIKLKNKV